MATTRLRSLSILATTITNNPPSSAFVSKVPYQSFRSSSTIHVEHEQGSNSNLDTLSIFTDGDENDLLPPSQAQATWNMEDDWSALSSSGSSPDYAFSIHASANSDVMDNAERILVEQDETQKESRFTDQEWGTFDDSMPTHARHHHDNVSFIKESTSTAADSFVDDAVETIWNHLDYDDQVALYDTKSSEASINRDTSEQQQKDDDELIYMIRCNQNPEQFLLSQGKLLPELTDEEKYCPDFLFVKRTETQLDGIRPEITALFKDAIHQIFNHYSVEDEERAMQVMDRNSLSQWMSTCLSYNLNLNSAPSSDSTVRIGPYDNAINVFLSRYSLTHGSGQLTLDEFTTLYLESAWVGHLNDIRKESQVVLVEGQYHSVPSMEESVIVKDRKNTDGFLKQASLRIVWRDLEAHGIFSPAEEQRVQLMKDMEKLQQSSVPPTTSNNDMLMDECELFDDYEDRLLADREGQTQGKRKEKSSHEQVEMTCDGKTSKRIRDGEFVFIDEESCIGCSQCATIAPSSFKMLEDTGRARTFYQRNTDEIQHAVLSCPVDCMHRVSYDELKEMELARDADGGFGGKTHVPVHVAGRDSDANRKSSWYHYLKAKCACPQQGCYDCPSYAQGENPYFKLRHKKAEHVRANDFIASGEAEQWRMYHWL